jgi:L-lactate utilization protein LutC
LPCGISRASAATRPTIREAGQFITFISEPASTSDIGPNRVEVVHGLGSGDVLVVDGAAS